MTVRNICLFIAISFAPLAQAQWMGDTDIPRQRPVPQLPITKPSTFKVLRSLRANEISDAQKMGLHITATFKAALARSDKAGSQCGSPTRDDYLRGLLIRGEYEKCVTEVRRCLAKATFGEFLAGGQCAASAFDHANANQFFTQATDRRFQQEINYSYAVFQFASYQFSSPEPQLTEQRLRLNSQWSENDRRILSGIIEAFGRGRTALASDAEIENHLTKAVASPLLTELWQVFWVEFPTLSYEWENALARLIQKYPSWQNPLNWASLAYDIYFSQDANHFGLAKYIYESRLPYIHLRSGLPLEQNVYTYTEIQNSVCTGAVLQGADAKRFNSAKSDWTHGDLSTERLREVARSLPQDKSDVLTVLGTLSMLAGNLEAARTSFWRAHQLCPYFNRSHWGLFLLNREKRFASYPDRAQIEAKMNEALRKNPASSELSTYVVNWRLLNSRSRDFVTYGSRYWRNQLAGLSLLGRQAYIKSVFELLSETPRMGSLRDKRIGYDGDNRLWDDVRGAGGQVVIADLIEVEQTPFGAYNLLAHEMAHQFHYYIRAKWRPGARCVSQLYKGALARDLFADGYSRTNEDEYFAQGVTFESIDEDAHPRFGLNRSWIKANDPSLFQFLEDLKSSDEDLSRIECPD